MIRQYRKIIKFIKKYKRKSAQFLKKNIPLVQMLSDCIKKFWSRIYCIFGSIDELSIVFISNDGKDYSGTPALIYERILHYEKYKNYKFVWLVNNVGRFKVLNSNYNTRIYALGSRKGIRIAAKAHYVVTNYELRPYHKFRKQQILVFDPEEYYGSILFLGSGGYQLQKVLRYANYITISNKKFEDKIINLCEEYGNRKVKVLESNSYLVGITETNKNEFVNFNLPKEKQTILISLKNKTMYTTAFLSKLEKYCKNKRTFVFRNEPIILDNDKVRCGIVKSEDNNESNSLYFDDFDSLYNCPEYISRKELYPMIDILITDKFNEVIESIVIKKPVIWLYDDKLSTDGIERQALLKLQEKHPQINMAKSINLLKILKKDEISVSEENIEDIFSAQNKENIDILDRFINPETGSADGVIKRYLRRYPDLFELLKKANMVTYNVKALKKKVSESLKKIIKNIDLKVLYVYYTFTGFFRKHGINLGKNAKSLCEYKNKHRGERCFLVGNGPSLTTKDLELIQKEITFGCNRVYKLFTNTTWRPTYFCMIDALIAKYSSDELAEYINCPMFTNINTRDLMEHRPQNLIFARNLGEDEYRISDDFAGYYVPSGATVMTFMVELAMYMGFSEIYLLGVDCTSSLVSDGHCAKGYVNEELVKKDIERVQKRLDDPTLTAEQVAAYYFDKSTFSYRVLREYADKHNIDIFNATRGGMLEVYERRNLDEVIRG